MQWYTSNLSNILNSEVYKKIQEYAKLNNLNIDNIEEKSPILEKQECKYIKCPGLFNFELDIDNSTIIFDRDISGYELNFLRSKSNNCWVYVKNHSIYGGTLQSDNKTIKLKNQLDKTKNYSDAIGQMIGQVTAQEYYKWCTFQSDPNPSWTKPCIFFDLSQIFDTKTYDGSFPINLVQASAISSAIGLWAYVDELVFNKDINNQQNNNLDLQNQLNKLIERNNKLESAIKTFNESIK